MRQLFARYGFNLSDEQLLAFEKYFALLAFYNAQFDLTAITEREAVYEKHFLDSILAADEIADSATLVDVGSGAGFPAVPLKIVRPDLRVTAVDSLAKRVTFLGKVAEELAVDLAAVHSRAEDFAVKHREAFDIATARAVAPLNILLEYLAPLVKVGGKVLCYKTDEAETTIAAHAAAVLGLKLHKTRHFELPSGAKRCIIIYKKVNNTPHAYPRGGNKPRIKPL
jgi:16S rRNA (guanine527-N7)-methyltransferase